MSHGDLAGWGRGHSVGFYALDSEGFDAVARFVADGWDLGECVVLLSTPAHLADLEARLRRLGHDPQERRAHRRLFSVDAQATVSELLVDGVFDAGAFVERVRELLSTAAAAGVPVRAFGEVVSVLWQSGHVQAAIEVELCWNDILRERPLALLCAYPTGAFDSAQLVDVQRICDLHTDLVPATVGAVGAVGASASAGRLATTHACSRVYLPTPESVPAARHFVVDVLRSWGHDALVPDAALIVSELATNALRHAGSVFRAVVDRRGGGLRIGIEDSTTAPLEPREATIDDLDGRGAHIVEALSRRWGHHPVMGGKVVWAELPVDVGTPRAC
jgi:anti-sigma regulatory factor (Ser/Thr protein kinase)